MNLNFRQTYYGKLGYKGVEEKGKLEYLLSEKKVMDLNKLKLFAEEYGVHVCHSTQRLALWSYLSSLCPIYHNSVRYVLEQRETEFLDLKSAALIIKLVDDSAPLERIYYTMWMLETNRLPFGNKIIINDDHPFIVIAKTLRQMFQESEEFQVYFLAKSIFSLATNADIDGLVAQTYSELEAIEPALLKDLELRNILQEIPVSRWIHRCFAGVIIHTSLASIWDKVIGGAPKVLVYVFIKMLQYLREKLLSCESHEKIERQFDIFMEQEAADRVVTKAIEMLEINNKK